MRCIAFQLSPEEKPLSLNRQKRTMWYEQSGDGFEVTQNHPGVRGFIWDLTGSFDA